MVTSIDAGVDAAIALIVAASIRATDDPTVIAPPCVIVLGEGASDLAGIGRVGIRYQYKLTCVARNLTKTSATLAALRALVTTVLGLFVAAAGWQIISIGAESAGTYAGADYLAADIIVSTNVTI